MGNLDKFKGMGKANNNNAVFMTPGHYVVEILKVREFLAKSRLAMFAVHFKILQSDNTAHPVGSERDWSCKENPEYPTMFLGNVKYFLECLNGAPFTGTEEEIDAEAFEAIAAITSAENPAAGTKMLLEVLPPKAGKKYTQHVWALLSDAA